MSLNLKIKCVRCKALVSDDKFLPFCSERCKLIDLGAWANEEYKVSRPVSSEEIEDETDA